MRRRGMDLAMPLRCAKAATSSSKICSRHAVRRSRAFLRESAEWGGAQGRTGRPSLMGRRSRNHLIHGVWRRQLSRSPASGPSRRMMKSKGHRHCGCACAPDFLPTNQTTVPTLPIELRADDLRQHRHNRDHARLHRHRLPVAIPSDHVGVAKQRFSRSLRRSSNRAGPVQRRPPAIASGLDRHEGSRLLGSRYSLS